MYTTKLTESFLKDLKKLSKKYKSVQKDLIELIEEFEKGILTGTKLQGFDTEVYKIRLKSSDNNKGKSSGFRVIYEVKNKQRAIKLIEIYSKSEKSNFDKNNLRNKLTKH